MLRDELLRSKNDEIARCLSSRKRKLSELYFATVGFAGATDNTPEGAHYRQKEAAFLDANDLTKGRFYDEATLPKRPDITDIKLPDQHEDVSREDVRTKEQEQGPDGVSVKRSEEEPPVSSAPVQQDGIAKPPLHTHDRPHPQPAGQGRSQSAVSSVSPVGVSSATTDAPSQLISQDVAPSKSDGLATNRPVLDSSTPQHPTQRLHTPPSISVSTQPQSEAPNGTASALSITSAAASTKPVPTEVSSAAVAPGAQSKHHEGMSPASSGPSSSQTSATEASPKSSSTEESLVRPMDAAVGPKLQDDTQQRMADLDRAIPDGVSATPDGQLRREAAISYGDSKDATGEPSTQAGHGDQINQYPTPGRATTPGSAKPVEGLDETPTASMVDQSGTTLTREEPSSKISEGATTKGPLLTPQPSTLEPEVPDQPEQTTHTEKIDATAVQNVGTDIIMDEVPKKEPGESPAKDMSLEGQPAVTRQPGDGHASLSVDARGDRQKPKSNVPTVVFPKHRSADKEKQVDQIYRADTLNEEKDYLYSLFQAKAHCPPRSMNLSSLLSTAHKTLNTSNHFLDYEEQTNCRTLKRIYQLQNGNKWPLRQLQRASEPQRSASHWDILLDHMKWMSTDFKEERKWKITAAKRCADWCAEYVASDEEGRSMLRVKPKRRPSKLRGVNSEKSSTTNDVGRLDELADGQPTPDLVPSMDDDSVSEGFNDDMQPNFEDVVTPASIFALGSDEFTFRMEKTPASDNILGELPLYQPIDLSPETKKLPFQFDMDGEWKKELLPVSKYATCSLGLDNEGPPRKRSRYDYSAIDINEDEETSSTVPIPPEQRDVALFQAENKHIRDRIHPGHSFRPPTEYAMPSLGFYEARQSSQWSYAEDDELRKLVREYSYNWSLISSCMSPQSKFSSGADRRTPWECFERWIGLEGLPADMAKTPYFRHYSARLEAAQRNVLAAQQQQQQQSGNNTGNQALVRRRTTQPLRVERKRTTRHLTMLAGMRKLSQKREAVLQKQQHATHVASLRKANEANQSRPQVSTPAEFSRLKFEREVKYQEKSEQYRQHMIAQQRAALAQRMAQQHGNQPMPSGAQGRNPNAMPMNGTGQPVPGNVPQGAAPNGLPAANGAMGAGRSQVQPMPNGVPGTGPANPVPMKMMPQSGVPQQPQTQMNGRPVPPQGSPDNARIIREASRVHEQQRLVQSRQQQQQFQAQQQHFPQQGPQSSPNMGMSVPNANPNNPGAMGAFQAGSGVSSPSFNAPQLAQGANSSSPRVTQPNPLSTGPNNFNISALQQAIQRSNPNLTPEQANKVANDKLQHYQQQHRISQAALNAAAGNIGSMPPNYQMPPDQNSQQQPQQQQPVSQGQAPIQNGAAPIQASQTQGYSPLMRVTQANQPNRMSVNGSPAMNGAVMQQSRNATPQSAGIGNNGQGGSATGTGKSPRPPQAQPAGS